MKTALARISTVAAALAVAVSLFVAGRAPASARTPAASLPLIKMGDWVGVSGSGIPNIDPTQNAADYQNNFELLIHAGLVVIGTNDKVEPQLASRWTVSKNHKVYTFYLRPNARFSNGDPVTASDVVYSLKRAIAPASANPTFPTYDGLIQGSAEYNGGKTKNLSGVKAVGKDVVRITATKAAPFFLKQLSYGDHFILDPKVEGTHPSGPVNNYMTHTCGANVGAGPFRVVCNRGAFYPSGQSPFVNLEPNPYFYGPKPHVRLQIPVVTSFDTGYSEYRAGQIDNVTVPPTDLAQARKRKGEFAMAPAATVTYIALNAKTAPFDNVNCRKAVAFGINRDAIVKVLHNAPLALYTVLPKAPGYPGAISPASHPSGIPYYNPTKARQYFAKCGTSTPVKYTYNHASTDQDNLASVIVAGMQGAGFNAKTDPISTQDWQQDINHPMTQSGLQASRYGWLQDYPDTQDFMDNLFTCTAPENIMGWCNKKFDSLVDRADYTLNNKTRASLYFQAEKILLVQDAAVVPYDTLPTYGVNKTRVHGLMLSIAYDYFVPKNLDWSKVSVK